MKKFIVPVLLATLTMASAQSFAFGGKKGGSDRSNNMIDKLDELVDLSSAQKAQLRTIKQEYKLDRKEMRESRKALRELDPSSAEYNALLMELADAAADQARQKVINSAKMRADVQAVLTPEQQAYVEEHMAQRAERRESQGDH